MFQNRASFRFIEEQDEIIYEELDSIVTHDEDFSWRLA